MTTIVESPLTLRTWTRTETVAYTWTYEPGQQIVEWVDDAAPGARLGFWRLVSVRTKTTTHHADRLRPEVTSSSGVVRAYCRRVTVDDVFDEEHPEEIEVDVRPEEWPQVLRALGLWGGLVSDPERSMKP